MCRIIGIMSNDGLALLLGGKTTSSVLVGRSDDHARDNTGTAPSGPFDVPEDPAATRSCKRRPLLAGLGIRSTKKWLFGREIEEPECRSAASGAENLRRAACLF